MSEKRPELQVGQKIYIEFVDFFSGSVPKEPEEYIVTKTNTKSIYAKPISGHYEQRFDKKTWACKSFGDTGYIWLSPDDYWAAVKRSKDKKVLRSRIAGELSGLSLEQLQEVAKLLDIKIN